MRLTAKSLPREYRAGFDSGKYHTSLSPHFRTENARKCISGQQSESLAIRAYWSGSHPRSLKLAD